MNIDDILAEVGGDETPGKAWDLQELTRCWVTERSAPEILPWPSALMDRVLERVRLQVSCHSSANRTLLMLQPTSRLKWLKTRSAIRTRKQIYAWSSSKLNSKDLNSSFDHSCGQGSRKYVSVLS